MIKLINAIIYNLNKKIDKIIIRLKCEHENKTAIYCNDTGLFLNKRQITTQVKNMAVHYVMNPKVKKLYVKY